MKLLAVDEFVSTECRVHAHEEDEYEKEVPRWCKGCGDHGVLQNVQRLLQQEQLNPEEVVAVSGIGCSSRLPHYLRTYGFHGIHGRALPISLGIKLARPDLTVLTFMGDGDCFSIGAGHWMHTLRYNPDILVVVMDNNVYALTKKQASPTSAQGQVTNTTPHGSYLRPLNPLSVILGVSNTSFLAQSASWYPVHMRETLRAAWSHRGLSFVRILQRCPVYMPDLFGSAGTRKICFLEDEAGIPVDHSGLRGAEVITHDHSDLGRARDVSDREDIEVLGLIYQNRAIPTYEELRYSHVDAADGVELAGRLNAMLDRYAVDVEQP